MNRVHPLGQGEMGRAGDGPDNAPWLETVARREVVLAGPDRRGAPYVVIGPNGELILTERGTK